MATIISEEMEKILEEQGILPDPRAQRLLERNERLRDQERACGRRLDKDAA